MTQTPINNVILSGYLYEHDLKVKKVQNEASENVGMEYISGTIEVATDDECNNIVPVHFTYVPKTKKDGTPDKRFATLTKIIESKTYIADKEEAVKIRVNTNIALNEFYVDDPEAENGSRLVSAKRCEGGFISFISNVENEIRNKFKVDMVISEVKRVEANEEKNIPEFVRLRGCIFDFKRSVLPVDFIVKDAGGMKYFEDLGVDNSTPVFTQIWGKLNFSAIKEERRSETAFGEDEVTYYDRKIREWIVTGTQKMPYDFDEDSPFVKPSEVRQAMQDREVYLATLKKRQDDYKESRAASTPKAAETPTVSKGGFVF